MCASLSIKLTQLAIYYYKCLVFIVNMFAIVMTKKIFYYNLTKGTGVMKNYIQKGLGGRIQQLRREIGYSQEQFAEKIGIAINTLSNIERGNSFMTAQTLEKMISALNTTPQELFNFSKNDKKEDTYLFILKKIEQIKSNKYKMETLKKFIKFVL